MLPVYGVIFLSILLNCAAQLLFRAGMIQFGKVSFEGSSLWPLIFYASTSPYIICGIFFSVTGLVLWLAVLSRAEISLAYPMISLSYVITSVIAWGAFGENLSPMRIAGILVILAGVVLISRTA